MAETTEFELVSPEKLLISQPAEMVVVPGTEGDFGALPRHAPMITGVRPGVIDVYENGKVEKRIFVAGEYDHLPEAAFYMVGTIEDVVKKAESLKATA